MYDEEKKYFVKTKIYLELKVKKNVKLFIIKNKEMNKNFRDV